MSEFGQSIKRWRKQRGLSQLDLSLHANISSKHMSFLETGRAKPSREMVLQLCHTLNIPHNHRNLLLALSGFTEAYSRLALDDPQMQSVNEALTMMLDNHSPYPAVVFDWEWNIVMANQPHQILMQQVAEQQPHFPDTLNAMELLFDPNGFRPFIKNWQEIAFFLLQRLHLERLMYQDRNSDLIARLLTYPDVPTHWQKNLSLAQTQPMIQIELIVGKQTIKLFSTLASFGTAIDITMQELTIEQYFPADELSKQFLCSLKTG